MFVVLHQIKAVNNSRNLINKLILHKKITEDTEEKKGRVNHIPEVDAGRKGCTC